MKSYPYTVVPRRSFSLLLGSGEEREDYLQRLLAALMVDPEAAEDYADEHPSGRLVSMSMIEEQGAKVMDAALLTISQFVVSEPPMFALEQIVEFSPRLAMWTLSWLVLETLQYSPGIAFGTEREAIEAIFHVQSRFNGRVSFSDESVGFLRDGRSFPSSKSFEKILAMRDVGWNAAVPDAYTVSTVLKIEAFRCVFQLCELAEHWSERAAQTLIQRCGSVLVMASYPPERMSTQYRDAQEYDDGIYALGRELLARVVRGISERIFDYASGASPLGKRVLVPSRSELDKFMEGQYAFDVLDKTCSGLPSEYTSGVALSIQQSSGGGGVIEALGSAEDMAVTKNMLIFPTDVAVYVVPIMKSVMGGRLRAL